MSARRQRKSFAKPQRPRLQIESLEPRQMLSGNPIVIPIVSGTTYTFKDADNTTVKIKLTGAGSGQLTLTNGLKTGGAIDTLSITGTNTASQLKITAAGGGDDMSTINSLTVGQTPVNTQILQQFTGSGLNVAANGVLQFNGSVGGISIETVGAGAEINVTGGVSGQFIAQEFDANSSVNVVGTLYSLNVQSIDAGAEVVAGTLTKLNVGQAITNASISAGSGGIQSAFIQSATNADIWTAGSIGSVIIQTSSAGSAIAANRNPGSDGMLGTIDDFTISASSSVGAIGPVTLNGAVVAGASGLQLIATGTIGTVTVPAGQPQPQIIDDAISQFIPLEIAQAVANATGFDDDEIWIAIFGEETVTPPSGQSAPPGITYFLDAANQDSLGSQPTPIPISTATLNVGLDTPDMAILPSSTIAAWANGSSQWGSNLQLPVPSLGNQFSGRILISVGAPIQAQVIAAGGTVAAPSASSLTDPSTGTFYDFLEFTVTNNGGIPNLDIDTSQVDSFGLPMTLQFFQDVLAQTPFNVNFTGTVTLGSNVITNIANMSGLQTGQIVTGIGIPPGAIIDSLGTSSITLSAVAVAPAASTPGSAVSLSALNGGPVGVDGTRNEILYGPNASSLLTFLNDQLTAGNEGARPFLQSAAPFETAGAIPIVGATASGSLIVTTDSTANLADGDWVTISGVVGTTAANGLFEVSHVTANSFQLVGATSNGAYVSGGSWSMAIRGATNPGGGNPIVITAASTGDLKNGDFVEVVGVEGNTNANGFFAVSNVTATTFTLVGSDGSGAVYTQGGTWSVYGSGPRLVSPKDIVEALPSAGSVDELNNYFNEAIDAFFLQYLPTTETNLDGVAGGGETFSIVSTASGSSQTYSGVVKNLGSYGYGLFLTSSWSATPFVIFYPFTTSNAPSDYTPKFHTVAPLSYMPAGLMTQSASQMIFACDGVFADNTYRAQANPTVPASWSKTLGDLENSIVTAFNRGIALEAPSSWGDRTTWFQQSGQSGKYNYWVEYWHESGLAVNDLAYAFPYDDKYGSSTNLNVNSVGLARVLLNQWSNSQLTTTTTFQSMPANAQQQGPITLSANVATTPSGNPLTGTVTFFVDGVAINSNDFSATPPQQPVTIDGAGNATISATLPALSSGSTTHTYTVTAVYSGDEHHAPSVVYQSLQLIGVNGDFLMAVTPDQASLGTHVGVKATLPGPTFDGSVALSISLSDGTGSQLLSTTNVTGPHWSSNVPIPANLLSFVGDVTTGSNKIDNVVNVVNLLQGQQITSSYFAGTPSISHIQPPSLVLSQVALLTGTVTFESNGVQFTATTTKGQTTLAGLNNLTGLAQNASITQVTGNSQLLTPGTTVDTLVPGWVEVNGVNANNTASGVTITSNGAGAVFPLKAVFTPTSGGPYTAYMGFRGPLLP